MGRDWASPAGNLYASTIARLVPGDSSPSTLAFVAALAAHDTIGLIAPDVAIQLKWPNDVLSANGQKLCGILLERAGDAIVAGFGINLVWHPVDIGRPVSDLGALGANPPAAQPAWGSVLDALREADETLATVLTGVDNQASAQTLLQVQQGQQQAGAQGALASSLVKNEANARLQAISRMV